MNSFFVPKKKVAELGIMVILMAGLFFIFGSWETIALFGFGFVWNWSASNDLGPLFDNKRYRMSMLKMVVNLQNLVLKPFRRAPKLIQSFFKIFPAGIFCFLVIFINESTMPWWATFLGSLAFELLQLDLSFLKPRKEIV